MRAREQAAAIRARGGVGELGLGRDLDDAVERLQRAHRLREAHRVADLDRGRERGLRLDRLERRPSRRDSSRRAGSRSPPARRRSAAACRSRPSSSISSKPAPSADTLPRLPPGITTQSGTVPAELLRDLDRDRLLALEAQRVHRVREVDALACRRAPGRAPCSRRSRCRARARARPSRAAGRAAPSRSCRAAGSRPRGSRRPRRTRRAPPRCRRSTRTRSRGSAARRAIICLTIETSTVIPRSLNEPECEVPHCLTRTSPSPSAARVARHAHQVRAALGHRHDVVGAQLRRDPLVLAPHAGSPRLVDRCASARRTAASTARPIARAARRDRARPRAAAARRAAIDDLIERIRCRDSRRCSETRAVNGMRGLYSLRSSASRG